MRQKRDIFTHILRTVFMVFALAAAAIGLFLVMFYLRLHPYVIFATLGISVVGVVYGTARWHPYWAPIAKRVARIPWRRDDGAAMETLVERAIVQAGSTRTETYRVSIYQCEGHRRVARRVWGDGVDFLGIYDSGIWFYIRDRFYARRDGLVCVDKQSGQWAYRPAEVGGRSDRKRRSHAGHFRRNVERRRHAARSANESAQDPGPLKLVR